MLALLCYLAAVGLSVLSALRAGDEFGLGPAQRGLVAASFGVAGLLIADAAGRLLDRLGPIRLGALPNTVLLIGLLLSALGPTVGTMVAGIIGVGVAVTAMWATINTVAATSAPQNRGGAASLALAFQFFEGAIAPLLWVPLYGLSPLPRVRLTRGGASAGSCGLGGCAPLRSGRFTVIGAVCHGGVGLGRYGSKGFY